MKVNIVNLRREMAEGLNRSVYPEAQRRVENYFEASKRQLVKSFEGAPPSVELDEVANMSREARSEYESKFVENGNLYAFMGFENDRNPVKEVKEILEDQIVLTSISKGSVNQNGDYVITGKVQVPSLESINQASQVGFSTRGWIDALTKGLRGLPNFLFSDYSDKPQSRSGAGLEAKNSTGRGEFKPYDGNYLSEFLERFKNKIRGRTQ